jgi:H+/gluconate symporter-like permease
MSEVVAAQQVGQFLQSPGGQQTISTLSMLVGIVFFCFVAALIAWFVQKGKKKQSAENAKTSQQNSKNQTKSSSKHPSKGSSSKPHK